MESRKLREIIFFSRRWRLPETGVLINCHVKTKLVPRFCSKSLAFARVFPVFQGCSRTPCGRQLPATSPASPASPGQDRRLASPGCRPRTGPKNKPETQPPEADDAGDAHHFPFHTSSACAGSAARCGSPIELRSRALLHDQGGNLTQPFGPLRRPRPDLRAYA